MARPLIVLAEPDEAYLAALECRFLEGLGDAVELEVISDEAYLLEFTSHPHDVEVMLLAEQWNGQQPAMLNAKRLLILTEEQANEGESTLGLTASRTFKYGSLDLIYNKAIKDTLLGGSVAEQDVQVLLCYSPVGGAGTTTAALAMASALNGMYKRVLYLDAEYVQSFASFMGDARLAPRSMARDMARGDGNAFSNVENYLARDGFDYLPPLRSGLAACGVGFEFFERLVRAASTSGRYDYIVVDTDSVFDEPKARLFALADHIVTLVTQDVHALHKVLKFFDNVDGSDAERYHFICNKYRKDEENAFAAGAGGAAVVLDGYVEYDPAFPRMDARALAGVDAFKRLAYVLAQ